MSVLKQLKLVANPASQPKSAEQFRRGKLIAKLQEQMAMAQAQLDGKLYKRTRWVTAANAEGEPVRVQRPVRLKQWWFKAPSGAVLLTVRYGAHPLSIANGMAAVELEKMEDLPQTISTIIQAVDAGELDAELAAAAKLRLVRNAKQDKRVAGKR
jgi:hypothetical protein